MPKEEGDVNQGKLGFVCIYERISHMSVTCSLSTLGNLVIRRVNSLKILNNNGIARWRIEA